MFEKAIQRQLKVNSATQKCIVFMDEAGLPEDSRESMKVLHYFLEGHMSAKAAVGFVAITNHVLDAAKSNRCVTLYREEPDSEELLTIANGVLFDAKSGHDHSVRQIQCDGTLVDANEFSQNLCASYTKLLHDEDHFKWFRLFFGLRDFIYFLRAIRNDSQKNIIMDISKQVLIHAMERNFNGTDSSKLKQLASCFLGFIMPIEDVSVLLRHPLDVVRDAIKNNTGRVTTTRFKLIIDETDDDSIMRLLSIEGSFDASKRCLFQLSNMPEGSLLEQSRLISGVKYSALQGSTIILSQTETVHECFYDLFNQNFRTLKDREGEKRQYANIAVGGISRRSLVKSTFQCIVHVRASELDNVPAPFLNRFEKFCLNVRHVLEMGWRSMPGLAKLVHNAKTRVSQLRSLLGENGLFGWVEGQTLESIFVNMLTPHIQERGEIKARQNNGKDFMTKYFANQLCYFLAQVTTLKPSLEDLEAVLDVGKKFLSREDSAMLLSLLNDNSSIGVLELSAAFNAVALGENETILSRIIGICVQMYITRVASFQLILLATPEAIFSCR